MKSYMHSKQLADMVRENDSLPDYYVINDRLPYPGRYILVSKREIIERNYKVDEK